MSVSVSPIESATPTAKYRWRLWIALVVLAAGFFSTIVSFFQTWSESRAHGFAIGVFCVWLAWTERARFRETSELLLPSAAMAAAMSVGWLLATIIGVRVGYQLAFPFVLLGWSAAVFGRRGLELALPIAGIFLLAVPFWEVLLGLLQSMTVAVNSVGVALMGLGATISGERIAFPFGTIEVAESCAGLSYFMSALTISVVYARLFLRTTPGRLVAVALAVALAIVSNWVRVFGLVLIGYYSKMTSPLMTEHATYGWVIFAVVLSFFFLLTGRIERWERLQPASVRDGWLARWIGESAQESSEFDHRPSARFGALAGATGAALIGPMLFLFFSWLPANDSFSLETPGVRPGTVWSQSAAIPSAQATAVAGDSAGKAGRWAPAYSGESQHVQQLWTKGATEVQVDRYLFRQQSQGAELIGGGNRIADPERTISERVVGPLDANLRTVQEAVVRTPGGARLVWYWYRVADTQTSSAMRAKLLELVAFFGRRGPSELTAVSAPCGAKDCSQALEALYNFVTAQEFPRK